MILLRKSLFVCLFLSTIIYYFKAPHTTTNRKYFSSVSRELGDTKLIPIKRAALNVLPVPKVSLTKEKLRKRLDPGASKTFSSTLPEIQTPNYFQSAPCCDELGASRPFHEVIHRGFPLIPAMGRSFLFSEIKISIFLSFLLPSNSTHAHKMTTMLGFHPGTF